MNEARIAELEAALASEKQCALLNAEGHTREIRQLQDMLEAEVEARREAETISQGWEERFHAMYAENRELKMQAIADHAQFQEAVERLPNVTDPIAVHQSLLADPIAVHINMLAGTIAKPSVEAIIHVYGHKALCAALRETDGVPPPALTDTKTKGSETP